MCCSDLFVEDHLILGARINPPFLNPCALTNFTNCTNPGIEIELIQHFAFVLKFTFTLYEAIPPANMSNRSSMDQLLIDLENGVTNMSGSFLTIKTGEIELDYTVPMFYYRKAFLIKKPSTGRVEFLLTLPFSPLVWTCFLIMIPSYFIALTFTAVVLKDSKKYHHLSHNAWTVLSSIVKPVSRTRMKPHKGKSQKFLMFTWQLGKTIILGLYSASLVGFLFHPIDPAIPFSSTTKLVDLVRKLKYQIVEIRDNQFLTWTSNLTKKEELENLEKDYPPIVFNSSDEAVRYVGENSNVVLVGYNTNLLTWAQLANLCEILVIDDEDEDMHMMAFGFKREFIYAEHFKQISAQLADSYFANNLYIKYVKNNTLQCKILNPAPNKKMLIPLTVVQLQGTFYILAFGAFAGWLAMLHEAKSSCRFLTICRKKIKP